MSNRLNAIRHAARPKMFGRAMISGVSGSGKTLSGLSIASVLAKDTGGSVLLIDTERESALTYADVYDFEHLPWRPPFDPTELTETLGALGDSYAVVMIDSLTHFWRSQGGTLDIADGKIGGWKTARPVQEALVQAILAVPAHVLLCVRSKMEYLIENNGRQVTKVGLAPIQDETLMYEVNVAFSIDLEHRLSVEKSRSTAVPVGRMYPAGLQTKAAEDYAEWLAGGVPPAAKEDVEAIIDLFGSIVDSERRKAIKAEFVTLYGMPQTLTANHADEAKKWVEDQFDEADVAHLVDQASSEEAPAEAEATEDPEAKRKARARQVAEETGMQVGMPEPEPADG